MSHEDDIPTGSQLDQNHVPETNGRMAVCRRCGSQTDGPDGIRHMPADRQMTRVREWLVAELTKTHIDRVRRARGG